MNKKINIWGRSIDLPVDFDTYKDEKATEEQEERLDAFCKESDNLLKKPEPVCEYCLEKNKEDIGSKITNIFAYVIPRSIFVPMGKRKSVVILCDYKFDEEHGIGIEFIDHKLSRISEQDDFI